MASNSMFVIMSYFSYFSLLLQWKEINDANATYSFLPTTTGESVTFDIMINWYSYDYMFSISHNDKACVDIRESS